MMTDWAHKIMILLLESWRFIILIQQKKESKRFRCFLADQDCLVSFGIYEYRVTFMQSQI